MSDSSMLIFFLSYQNILNIPSHWHVTDRSRREINLIRRHRIFHATFCATVQYKHKYLKFLWWVGEHTGNRGQAALCSLIASKRSLPPANNPICLPFWSATPGKVSLFVKREVFNLKRWYAHGNILRWSTEEWGAMNSCVEWDVLGSSTTPYDAKEAKKRSQQFTFLFCEIPA